MHCYVKRKLLHGTAGARLVYPYFYKGALAYFHHDLDTKRLTFRILWFRTQHNFKNNAREKVQAYLTPTVIQSTSPQVVVHKLLSAIWTLTCTIITLAHSCVYQNIMNYTIGLKWQTMHAHTVCMVYVVYIFLENDILFLQHRWSI